MRGCGVSRRYIDVCYCDMFSVVNVYHDHLKFCVVCTNSRKYVCCNECMLSLMNVMSQPPALCNMSVRTAVKLCILGVLDLGVSLNCDDVCMCVVNRQFELLEFVSESVYVDLQYDEISFTFTAGYVCLCAVSSPVVVISH